MPDALRVGLGDPEEEEAHLDRHAPPGAHAWRHPLTHQPSPRGPARCVQCAERSDDDRTDGGDLLLVFFSIYVFSIFSSPSSRNDRVRCRAVCGRADPRVQQRRGRACS